MNFFLHLPLPLPLPLPPQKKIQKSKKRSNETQKKPKTGKKSTNQNRHVSIQHGVHTCSLRQRHLLPSFLPSFLPSSASLCLSVAIFHFLTASRVCVSVCLFRCPRILFPKLMNVHPVRIESRTNTEIKPLDSIHTDTHTHTHTHTHWR